MWQKQSRENFEQTDNGIFNIFRYASLVYTRIWHAFFCQFYNVKILMPHFRRFAMTRLWQKLFASVTESLEVSLISRDDRPCLWLIYSLTFSYTARASDRCVVLGVQQSSRPLSTTVLISGEKVCVANSRHFAVSFLLRLMHINITVLGLMNIWFLFTVALFLIFGIKSILNFSCFSIQRYSYIIWILRISNV